MRERDGRHLTDKNNGFLMRLSSRQICYGSYKQQEDEKKELTITNT